MEQNPTIRSAEPPKRKVSVLLIIAIVALLGLIGYLYLQLSKQKQLNVQYQEVQVVLEEEKNSLAGELKDLMEEYESLKSDNDSMNLKLEVQQNKIKKLLTLNASNLEKIQLYKKELVTLREIMKSYIVQIDSLNQRNQALVAENVEVKGRLEVARQENVQLNQEREQLSEKVQKASALAAKDILVTPMNRRSKETIKADKVEKLKVCFTVRENSIVEPGPRLVYLRIARPDQMVLASAATNLLNFQGDQVVYSEKREIEYDNADIDMCIYYDTKEGEVIPGTYEVDIFTDGNLIGSTTFSVK